MAEEWLNRCIMCQGFYKGAKHTCPPNTEPPVPPPGPNPVPVPEPKP
jgi:hypothetical protein